MTSKPPNQSDLADETAESGSSPPLGIGASDPGTKKQSTIYSRGRRELDANELASPVASTFMIDHIERLEAENGELVKFRSKYFESDARLKILENRASLKDTSRKVASLMLSVGSAGIGVSSSMPPSRTTFLLIVIFVAIAVGSFFLRVKDND